MTTEEIRKAVSVLGPARAGRALLAFPKPRRRPGETALMCIQWRDCPTAYIYGAPDRLRQNILLDPEFSTRSVAHITTPSPYLIAARLLQLPKWVVLTIANAYDDPRDRPVLRRLLQQEAAHA